eukprot:COSAG02_NODE_1996_length_10156_cov_5.319081_9_plen_128_part_00
MVASCGSILKIKRRVYFFSVFSQSVLENSTILALSSAGYISFQCFRSLYWKTVPFSHSDLRDCTLPSGRPVPGKNTVDHPQSPSYTVLVRMVYVQGGNVVGSRTENKMRGGFILDFFWGILNGIVLL